MLAQVQPARHPRARRLPVAPRGPRRPLVPGDLHRPAEIADGLAGRSDRLARGEFLERGDPLLDGRVGVVEVVVPGIVVLQRVVDAHRSGGMVHLLERLVVLLQFLERAQQPCWVTGQLHTADIGQRLAPA